MRFTFAKQILKSFDEVLAESNNVNNFSLSFCGCEKPNPVNLPEVIEMIQQIQPNVTNRIQRFNYERLAMDLKRLREPKEEPVKVVRLSCPRQRLFPATGPYKSVAEKVENALQSTIGKRMSGLAVYLEEERVVVKATVPSYYVRQLVEHKSRSIVVEQFGQTFVSRVAVAY